MKMFNSKKLVILINALIFTIGFNAPILTQRYTNYKAAGDAALYAAVGEFFFALAFIYPFLYALSIRHPIFKILAMFVYVISGLATYFIYSFKISINLEIIAAFFESSKDEALTFLNLELILGLIGSGLLGWIYILSVDRAECNRDQDKKLSFITIVFTLGCLIGDGDWVNNILPYNVLKESCNYFLEKTLIIQKRFDIASNYNYNIDDINSDDLNVVLIIGESARNDHFSLAGYIKETNPMLAKEGDNLVFYKDVTACYPLTRIAVPCMITRATRENRKISAKETSFISIFKKLGFYTTWIGMQGTYTAIDAPYFDLAKESLTKLCY